MHVLAQIPRGLAAISRALPSFPGKERLLRPVSRLLGRLGTFDARVDGVLFRLDTRELIDFRIAYRGAHEEAVLDCLVSAMLRHPRGVLWDVGANLGAMALPIAHRFPEATVVAFEPSPLAMARFMTNVSLNPKLAPRIHPYAVALSDSMGVARFLASDEVFNGGTGRFSSDTSRGLALHVISLTGDEIQARFGVPRPDVIKIDVEGFELEVLLGLARTLGEGPPVEVVFEHSAHWLRHRGQAFDGVVRFLEGLGFRLEPVGAAGLELSAAVLSTRDVDIHAQRAS